MLSALVNGLLDGIHAIVHWELGGLGLLVDDRALVGVVLSLVDGHLEVASSAGVSQELILKFVVGHLFDELDAFGSVASSTTVLDLNKDLCIGCVS